MNGLIRLVLALNVAVLGALLTRPAPVPVPALALPQFHPERIVVLGPVSEQAPDFCVRLARFSMADYALLRAWLREQGASAAQITLERTPGWWTYLPPVVAKQVAPVTRELAERGVKDAVLIKKGPLRNAFAFGIHASESRACTQRDALRAQGIGAVECGPRPLPNRALLSLPGADDTVLEGLNTAVPHMRATAVACVPESGVVSTVVPPPTP